MTTSSQRAQAAGTQWDPQQYLKFSDHRLRPALELLDRIPLEAPKHIYDLGCGTGQITRLIADRWPEAVVYGIDNSSEMLARAAAEPSRVTWLEADIHTWSPAEPPDLIYANASLQWIDGHELLFPRLVRELAADGCLAVQMPLSWASPSHQLMRDTLANGGENGQALGTESLRQAMAHNWVEAAAVYYNWLVGDTSHLDIWETEYLQILAGDNPVLEWVKSTGLRPILNGLDDVERARFLAEYTQRLQLAYPVQSDGRTLYPFRRLFIVAVR